jgi:hypothetical protein
MTVSPYGSTRFLPHQNEGPISQVACMIQRTERLGEQIQRPPVQQGYRATSFPASCPSSNGG